MRRAAILLLAATAVGPVSAQTLHDQAHALVVAKAQAEAAARMRQGRDLHWRTYAHAVESISGQRFDGLDALIEARNDPKFRQSSIPAEAGR